MLAFLAFLYENFIIIDSLVQLFCFYLIKALKSIFYIGILFFNLIINL